MARIRGDDLKPEASLRAALDEAGVRYARNVAGLPGRPDLLIGSTAVFVHGCFFHGCPEHYRPPKKNAAFWAAKLEGNRCRDARVQAQLTHVVVWEHELRRSAGGPEAVAARLSTLTLSERWFVEGSTGW
jgi:DNA mismatch endonuclease, patch repair protein